MLNRNALDLIQRDRIVGAVIELGGARALMCGHRLRVLESAAGLEVGGDAGRAEDVAAELDPTWTAGRDFAIENGRNAGG